MKKTVKIDFIDFWDGFCKTDNIFFNSLAKKYDIEISKTPDYLFYSCFGYRFLDYNCIKIFYTGENISPDFNLCDYAIGFDFLDFGDRYLRYPQFLLTEYHDALQKTVNRMSVECVNAQKKFCNFLCSNGTEMSPRGDFFQALSKYKSVDSGGRYLNNIGKLVENKLLWQEEYKFSIAFENSAYNGYVTEKIVEAFAAGTIPIYWGNPKIEEDFNQHAFINCNNFNNFEAVIDKIRELDGDDKKYLEMRNQSVFTERAKETYLQEQYLDDFLYHIMDQDLTLARRFPRLTMMRGEIEGILRDGLNYRKILNGYPDNFLKRKMTEYIIKDICH